MMPAFTCSLSLSTSVCLIFTLFCFCFFSAPLTYGSAVAFQFTLVTKLWQLSPTLFRVRRVQDSWVPAQRAKPSLWDDNDAIQRMKKKKRDERCTLKKQDSNVNPLLKSWVSKQRSLPDAICTWTLFINKQQKQINFRPVLSSFCHSQLYRARESVSPAKTVWPPLHVALWLIGWRCAERIVLIRINHVKRHVSSRESFMNGIFWPCNCHANWMTERFLAEKGLWYWFVARYYDWFKLNWLFWHSFAFLRSLSDL